MSANNADLSNAAKPFPSVHDVANPTMWYGQTCSAAASQERVTPTLHHPWTKSLTDTCAVTDLATSLPVTRAGHDLSCPYLRVRRRSLPDMELCTVLGQVDTLTETILQRMLTEIEHDTTPHVLLDLAEVTFLSVRGAHLLHHAVERTHAQARRLSIVVSHAVTHALTITGHGIPQRTYRTRCDVKAGNEVARTHGVLSRREQQC